MAVGGCEGITVVFPVDLFCQRSREPTFLQMNEFAPTFVVFPNLVQAAPAFTAAVAVGIDVIAASEKITKAKTFLR